MKIGIFLRLYELNIAYGRIKADFYSEHTSILKNRGKVIIGKAGAGFQNTKIESLNDYIKENGFLILFLYNAKQKRLYKAKVINVSNDLPSDSSLYPNYYTELSKIKVFFTTIELIELDPITLEMLKLATNKRNILDVIKSCRTSCMIVEYEQET